MRSTSRVEHKEKRRLFQELSQAHAGLPPLKVHFPTAVLIWAASKAKWTMSPQDVWSWDEFFQSEDGLRLFAVLASRRMQKSYLPQYLVAELDDLREKNLLPGMTKETD